MRASIDRDEPLDPDEVSEDRLLGGRVHLLQPRRGYRVAVDPVLLAAAVAEESGAVLDAGAGTGAAALCLAARRPDLAVTGLEREPELARLMRASVARNGLDGRVRVVEGDLLAPPAGLRTRPFRVVMTNPPYLDPAASHRPLLATRTRAHVAEVGVGAWLEACLRRLEPRGRLYVVHRADRLDELLAALAGPAGDIAVFPIWPRADAAQASRVVLRARKAAKGPARLLRGLVLHEADGSFTSAAEQVLRGAGALDFGDGSAG